LEARKEERLVVCASMLVELLRERSWLPTMTMLSSDLGHAEVAALARSVVHELSGGDDTSLDEGGDEVEMMTIVEITCPTSGDEDCRPIDSGVNRHVSSRRGWLPNDGTRRPHISKEALTP
jgi:hypothetical protein